MSSATSSASIAFPATMIDQEIKKFLEDNYGVEFEPQMFGPGPLEILGANRQVGDAEFQILDQIFYLNAEEEGGEFTDLEETLVKKGVPFDRESSMDWKRPPETRVFRPVNPPFDVCIPDDESSGPLVRLLMAAKAILPIALTYPLSSTMKGEFEAAIQEAESMHPDYPPLTDWVKEAAYAAPCGSKLDCNSCGAAIDGQGCDAFPEEVVP